MIKITIRVEGASEEQQRAFDEFVKAREPVSLHHAIECLGDPLVHPSALQHEIGFCVSATTVELRVFEDAK